MTMNELDDDFEPEFAVVPEGERLVPADATIEGGGHVRRAAIGITAGSYNNMVLLPRSEAGPLLRAIHAEPLPFAGYIGRYNGVDIELRHLDMITPVVERYFPDVTEFLYGPATLLEAPLREVNIEPAPLPDDFMDPFERGLARYAIYGS
jgi:hypothetical protein